MPEKKRWIGKQYDQIAGNAKWDAIKSVSGWLWSLLAPFMIAAGTYVLQWLRGVPPDVRLALAVFGVSFALIAILLLVGALFRYRHALADSETEDEPRVEPKVLHLGFRTGQEAMIKGITEALAKQDAREARRVETETWEREQAQAEQEAAKKPEPRPDELKE